MHGQVRSQGAQMRTQQEAMQTNADGSHFLKISWEEAFSYSLTPTSTVLAEFRPRFFRGSVIFSMNSLYCNP